MAEAKHIDRSHSKPVTRKYSYISARDLFYSIAGIQQQIAAQRQPGTQPASQKESAA